MYTVTLEFDQNSALARRKLAALPDISRGTAVGAAGGRNGKVRITPPIPSIA